jgi:hypothetical protein
MVVCPHCGYRNRPGELFCDECAHALYADSGYGVVATKELVKEGGVATVASVHMGVVAFEPGDCLVVHVRDAAKPIVLQPDSGEIVFGRTSSKSAHVPDVDLTPYNALEKGVSHIHARVAYQEGTLSLTDMGSVNGTYVNGQRLIANREHELYDGDEIRLGRLVAHVYFQKSA